MKRTSVLQIIGLILVLAVAASAKPRLALVKVLDKTSAVLDGRVYQQGFLVSEGQTLELGQGDRVSIKLLQANAEMQLVGPTKLVITRTLLEKYSKDLNRGNIALSDSLGSKNQAAALVVRDSIGEAEMAPELRKTGEVTASLIIFGGEPKRLRRGYEYLLVLQDHDTGEVVLAETLRGRIRNEYPLVGVRSGRRYQMVVTALGPPKNDLQRRTTLRMLSEDEKRILAGLAKSQVEAFEDEDDAEALVSLAECYTNLDQHRQAYELLRQNKPDFSPQDKKELADEASLDKLKSRWEVVLIGVEKDSP